MFVSIRQHSSACPDAIFFEVVRQHSTASKKIKINYFFYIRFRQYSTASKTKKDFLAHIRKKFVSIHQQ
jgi:hypothetical protein